MSTSFGKRLIDALGFAVVNIIFSYIFYKLLLCKEDWLYTSILWTIFWGIGRYFALSIANLQMNKKYKIMLYLLMVAIAPIHGLLVMRLLLKISQFKKAFGITVIPFVLGLSFTKVNFKEN